MGALLKLLITIPFVAVLLWLSFANRDSVTLTWSPFHEPANIPVAVVVLISVVTGFVWGSVITWLNYASVRREKRMNSKARAKLEKELQQTKVQGVTLPTVSSTTPTWTP